MVKINVKIDCGNAPKKEFIRDFEIAYAKKDRTGILQSLDPKIEWVMIGDKTLSGKDEVEKSLNEMFEISFTELSIENLMTHGKVGGANGTITLDNGAVLGFSDIFTFTSHAKDAKLKKISSYVVEIKK